MSNNKYEISLKVTFRGNSIEIDESGYTYNSTQDQVRNDLDNATNNALRILDKIEKGAIER